MRCDNEDVALGAEWSVETEIPAVFNLYQPSVNGTLRRKIKFPLQTDPISQDVIGVGVVLERQC